MDIQDLIDRDVEEIIQMLDEHGVNVGQVGPDGGFIVTNEGMGEIICDEMELCLLLWGVIAGKRRAASMI